ncbi:hypothetical protein L210DRAFT_3738247, partial [Boletus edulis BED1]
MLHSILATTFTVQCAETPSKIDLFEDLILNKLRVSATSWTLANRHPRKNANLNLGDPHRVPSATPPSCRLPVNAEVLSKAMSSIIDKQKSSSALLFKMNTAENINSSADNRASDGRKQSPPAFLDLADS